MCSNRERFVYGLIATSLVVTFFSSTGFVFLYPSVSWALQESLVKLNDKLKVAADTGNNAIVKQILAKGADVNCGDYTPLMIASHQGHFSVVKTLLTHGADVNLKSNSGVTALMEASIEGNYDIAKLLLKSGADKGAKTVDGRTALDMAASNGYSDIVKLLKQQSKHGAGRNAVKSVH